MLIYVEYITERLLYTLDFVFSERKIGYEITNDGIHFMSALGNKLNYSTREFDNCLQLVPASILFEEVIRFFTAHQSIFGEASSISVVLTVPQPSGTIHVLQSEHLHGVTVQ